MYDAHLWVIKGDAPYTQWPKDINANPIAGLAPACPKCGQSFAAFTPMRFTASSVCYTRWRAIVAQASTAFGKDACRTSAQRGGDQEARNSCPSRSDVLISRSRNSTVRA